MESIWAVEPFTRTVPWTKTDIRGVRGQRLSRGRDIVRYHQIVWQGAVKLFERTGDGRARRVFAWTHPMGKKRRFMMFRERPEMDSAAAAVRAALQQRLKGL
jgi:hypothetical protein